MKPLRRSGMDHTVQLHRCLPLPRKRSPDGASPDWGCEHLIAAYSLFYLPRKNARLSRPGWLTYSGRFTHIGLSGQWSPISCRSSAGQGFKVRRSKTDVLPCVLRNHDTIRYDSVYFTCSKIWQSHWKIAKKNLYFPERVCIRILRTMYGYATDEHSKVERRAYRA